MIVPHGEDEALAATVGAEGVECQRPVVVHVRVPLLDVEVLVAARVEHEAAVAVAAKPVPPLVPEVIARDEQIKVRVAEAELTDRE